MTKTTPSSLYSILDTEINKRFSDAFLNKPGKALSCEKDAKYGVGETLHGGRLVIRGVCRIARQMLSNIGCTIPIILVAETENRP